MASVFCEDLDENTNFFPHVFQQNGGLRILDDVKVTGHAIRAPISFSS